jgi:hypothetical protein
MCERAAASSVCRGLLGKLCMVGIGLGKEEGINLQSKQKFSKCTELSQTFTKCAFQKSLFYYVINFPESFKKKSRQS